MSTKPFRQPEPLPSRPGSEHYAAPLWGVYRCSLCHGFYVTVVVDSGATPMMIRCMDRPAVTQAGKPMRVGGCPGMMTSMGFPEPKDWPPLAPKVAQGEWYRPPDEEWRILRKRNQMLAQHVEQGGLLLRPPSASYQFPSIIPNTEKTDATDQG